MAEIQNDVLIRSYVSAMARERKEGTIATNEQGTNVHKQDRVRKELLTRNHVTQRFAHGHYDPLPPSIQIVMENKRLRSDIDLYWDGPVSFERNARESDQE